MNFHFDSRYVTQLPNGALRVGSSRISAESVVSAWLSGQSPETIQANFPSLSLESIHGTIAFYLHNRDEFDRYLSDLEIRWESLRGQSEQENAPLLQRLRAERSKSLTADRET